MNICQREGLHQVDLLSPAPDRISPQEYYAKQRGQQNLDIANMELMIEGITPMHTTFETGKEKIRNAISDIAERATSFEEFQRLLKAEHGISVKDHRGRFSYLPADRQKYISARALGSNYDRDRLLRIFAENARTAEQNNPHWAVDDSMAILFIKSDLRLVVALQTCVKAQQSRAYAQKVKISNLQQMARTVAYVQEHGYDSREKLSETADAIYTKMAKARGDAKLTESKLRKANEQIHYLGQYLSTKSIYGEFLKAPNKKIFRQAHSDKLAQYEESLQILKQHSPDGKFPTMKDLRAEKEQLTIQKDAQYDTYHLLMCDKEAIEVQKILPFLSDTWPLCRIGRAVIRASQSCRQSCNKSQCPACGCRSHHSCTHAPQFSRSFPAREWGSVLQRQGACGQCP